MCSEEICTYDKGFIAGLLLAYSGKDFKVKEVDRGEVLRLPCPATLRGLGLERANVSIGSIQRILGHENRSTTEIYLHSIGEAEREAMEVFEQATQDASMRKVSHRVSHR